MYQLTEPAYKMRIAFNLRKGHPTSSLLVRKAIAYALDVQEIIQRATGGLAEPAYGRWGKGQVPIHPDVTRYNYDPAKAEALLDQAGYKKGTNGIRFTLNVMGRRGEPEEDAVKELLRDQLAKIGIDVKLNIYDIGTLLLMMWVETGSVE